jgi:uncharacterized membrane protein
VNALAVMVLVASACLVAGVVLHFAAPGSAPAWLPDAGLVVLMATPVVRVVFAIVEFARSRDWIFVATALAVLLFLGISVAYSLSAQP